MSVWPALTVLENRYRTDLFESLKDSHEEALELLTRIGRGDTVPTSARTTKGTHHDAEAAPHPLP